MMKNWIANYYRLILFFFTGLAIASPLSFHLLQSDTSFDKFFPEGDTELDFYEEYTAHLGSAEQLLLLSVETHPHVFDSVFLFKMDRFLKTLNTFPELQGVQSVFNFNRQRKTAIGILTTPYIHVHKPHLYKQDSVLIFKDYPLTQFFISPDSRSVTIQLRLQPAITLTQVDKLLARADSLAAGLALPPLHIMGQKFLEAQFRQILKQETSKVFWASIGFVLLTLFVIYRSWKGVFIPLSTVIISILVFYAYMALFNQPLTIMASLFPTLMLIVGISDAIHFCSMYLIKTDEGLQRKQAVIDTLQEIGLTNFLTSFTTALGLLTLLTSSMEALRQFGLDTAIGVMLVYGVSILVTPSLLMWLGLTNVRTQAIHFSFMSRFLTWLTWYQAEKKNVVLAFTSLLTMAGIVGVVFLNVNNYMLTALPKDSRLFIDFTYFNQKQKGARTIEFALQTKPGHTFSEYYVAKQIETFHSYLETIPQVSKILSPVTHYRWASQMQYPRAGWKIPSGSTQFYFINNAVSRLNQVSAFRLLDSSGTWGRLVAVVPDMGRQNVNQLLLSLQTWMRNNTDSAVWEIHPTGIHFLMDRGHEHRVSNLFTGLLLAIASVSLVVGVVFKRWSYIWICTIANLIPLIITLGIMGLTAIEMRGTTSIIFAIGYVIAVDDTLHFINRFRLECKKGKAINLAVKDTLLHTGRSIIYTSLILMGGFSMLLFSSFGDIYTFGLLTSIILLTACLTNLFLVPVLTGFFIKK